MTNQMVLEIPPQVLEGLKLPAPLAQKELRRAFAVFLVREGLLSRYQARLLAGMERIEFEDLLAKHHIGSMVTADQVMAEVAAAESRLG